MTLYDDSPDGSSTGSDSDDCDTIFTQDSLHHVDRSNSTVLRTNSTSDVRDRDQTSTHSASKSSLLSFTTSQDVLDGSAFEDAVEHRVEQSVSKRQDSMRKALDSVDTNA